MRKLLFIGILCLTGMIFLNSCSKEYTITVVSNNAEWGTVSGTGTYADGSEIQISAIAKEGYFFIKWEDGNTDNPRAITVTEDATYTAIFSNNPNGEGGEGDPEDYTFSGNISENTTWPDRGLAVDYYINGWLRIEGNALLTIEPGVTIMFTGVDGGMEICENAGLKMVGTAAKPIKFVGPTNNPNNGSWNRIVLKSKRSDNQWEYVEFIRGGADEGIWSPIVDLESAKLSMKNCTIDGSLNNGMCLEYGSILTAFENNTIKNCAGSPIIIEEAESLFSIPDGNNTYTNNVKNYAIVTGGYYEPNENYTIKSLSIPYYFKNSVTIAGNRKLTIEAGTTMLFPYDTYFKIDNDAILVADGTASNPITFKAQDPENHWRGIEFRSNRTGNVMNYCNISDGGIRNDWDNSSLLFIDDAAKLTLTNCEFNKSFYGVWIEDINTWGNVTHSGNTFSNCTEANVHLEYEGEYNNVHYDEGTNLDALP